MLWAGLLGQRSCWERKDDTGAKGAVALAELSGGWGQAAHAVVPGLTGAGAAERRPVTPSHPHPASRWFLPRPSRVWEGGREGPP